MLLVLSHCGKTDHHNGTWYGADGARHRLILELKGNHFRMERLNLFEPGRGAEQWSGKIKKDGDRLTFTMDEGLFSAYPVTIEDEDGTFLKFAETEGHVPEFWPTWLRSTPGWTGITSALSPRRDQPAWGTWLETEKGTLTSRALAVDTEDHALLVDLSVAPDAQPFAKSKTKTDYGHFPFRLTIKQRDGQKRAAFAFLNENMIWLKWLESEDNWPDTLQGGRLWRRVPETFGNALAAMTDIGAEYGIRITTGLPVALPGDHRIQPAGGTRADELEGLLTVLKTELEKYPERTQFPGTIILARGVRDRGFPALFDAPRGQLVLDIETHHPAIVLHHGIYLALVHQDQKDSRHYRDYVWMAAVKRHGDADGYGRFPRSGQSWHTKTETGTGFISAFSSAGIREDQAQMFAAVMAGNNFGDLHGSVSSNIAFADKVYALYEAFPKVLEPGVAVLINDHGLPDRRAERKPLPRIDTPPVPEKEDKEEKKVKNNLAASSGKPEKPRTRPKAKTGIKVAANIGGITVLVDGRTSTPDNGFIALAPGEYMIEVQKKGCVAARKTMNVERGRTVDFKAHLICDPGAGDPEPTPAKVKTVTTKPKPKPPPKKATVELYFKGARKAVWQDKTYTINGQRYEQAGNQNGLMGRYSLPAGRHRFSVESKSLKPTREIYFDAPSGSRIVIECTPLGFAGRRLKITVNGRQVFKEQLERK
jgi:hypothetical protein